MTGFNFQKCRSEYLLDFKIIHSKSFHSYALNYFLKNKIVAI